MVLFSRQKFQNNSLPSVLLVDLFDNFGMIYAVNLENEKMKKYLALSIVVLGLSACSVVEDYNLNPLGWLDGGSVSSSE